MVVSTPSSNRRRRARAMSAAARAGTLGIVALTLIACTASPRAADGSESPMPEESPAAEEVAGLFDVGDGRRMYLECRGSGSPRVVFISGQRGSAEDWSIVADGVGVDPVFEQVSVQTRACAFDRPGTPVGESFSRSDPAPMPTTTGAMVDDLHALLEASGETGPTVIVAHSVGGLAGRLYSGQHPDDVAGIVFVDATSIGLQDAETPEQWEIQRELLAGDITESLSLYPDIERLDLDASFDQVRAAPPLQQMPLVVISADQPWGPIVERMHAAGELLPGVPADFGYVLDGAAAQSQAALAALLPGSRHITKTDSGHNVHQEQPQLVVDAIMSVVDELRADSQ
jgi:pimeloyl-ACP methyl ester carboxylesterase